MNREPYTRYNLKSLTVRKNDQNTVILTFTITDDPRKRPHTEHFISNRDIPQFISQLKDPYRRDKPYYMFDDLSYILKPHTQGIVLVYTSQHELKTGKDSRIYINYPGEIIAAMIELTESESTHNNLLISPLLPRPGIKLCFTDDGVKHAINRLLKSEHAEYTRNYLAHLTRMAKNNAPATITITWDHWQEQDTPTPSFYWVIEDENRKRVINGGFIYHKSSNTYSVHT